VLHLHGELLKVRSTKEPSLIYKWKRDLKKGDKCDLGSQLRPHIVWFGEEVSNIPIAAEISRTADIYIVIGTSLQVYPAAGLIHYTNYEIPKYIIDPKRPTVFDIPNLIFIEDIASAGMKQLEKILLNNE
jgi:NAD-dependent deacetylase